MNKFMALAFALVAGISPVALANHNSINNSQAQVTGNGKGLPSVGVLQRRETRLKKTISNAKERIVTAKTALAADPTDVAAQTQLANSQKTRGRAAFWLKSVEKNLAKAQAAQAAKAAAPVVAPAP